jgi:glutamate/tyrosine decarboxylase-like PLP-dependent enzyme
MALDNIEAIRELFFDPKNPEKNRELNNTILAVMEVMSQIYASGGQFGLMSDEVKRWMTDQTSEDLGEPTLEMVSAQIMSEELATRLFDEKFMGQIHPWGNGIGIIGNLVAAFMNTNTIVAEVSKGENRMEQEVLDTLAKWFGYDTTEYAGNIVTGGTLANMQAMWVAREKIKEKLSPKEHRNTNYIILGSSMAHYSVDKAANILNMEKVELPTVGFKTDVTKIREVIEELLNRENEDGSVNVIAAMIGIPGETETGMVDDLNAMADIAEEYGIHLHFDAAYGGPFVLSKVGHLFDGMGRADSITVDPHKMLYVPYAAGAVLFKDGRDLTLVDRTMARGARYLVGQQDDGEDKKRDFGMSRVEGSMGAAGVIATWATMQLFKEQGFETLLDYTIDMTNYLHRRVSESLILTPLHNPETNTLLVGTKIPTPLGGFETYNNTLKVTTDRLEKLGYYVSRNGHVDNGRTALRFVIVNPFTTEAIIDEIVDLLEKELADAFGLD